MGISRRGTAQGVFSVVQEQTPQLVELFSNQWDWRDLGSWVFDLNRDVGKFFCYGFKNHLNQMFRNLIFKKIYITFLNIKFYICRIFLGKDFLPYVRAFFNNSRQFVNLPKTPAQDELTSL